MEGFVSGPFLSARIQGKLEPDIQDKRDEKYENDVSHVLVQQAKTFSYSN